MELYLQFGWGMKTLTLDFAEEWDTVNVILSPRDITPQQLQSWSRQFSKKNISCLFDPQAYFPKTNHKRLSQYSYWNNSMSTYLSSDNNYETSLIRNIFTYNEVINTRKFIIPAIMRKFDDKWIQRWQADSIRLIEATRKIVDSRDILLTLALPSELLCQTEDLIERMIEISEQYDVNGYYVVIEPPNGQYLVDNPLWLSNVLQLCAGLKLLGKELIFGYANQQMLSLTVAKVDAIASGTYLNVRKFSNKFEDLDQEIKRKSTWYYYPEALSEYKISFLDVAYNAKVLDEMRPKNYNNSYIDFIFSGAMPSSTAFNETLAFKHYLDSLRHQTQLCTRDSFRETVSANEMLLETAERRIEFLEQHGVYAQTRSFKDIVDVNRSAIQRLQKTRGFLLEYSWGNL